MSDINPSQNLHHNLTLLQHFIPASPDFVKCFKENMFAKPNRTAFDQVLFYLCNAYDPARYRPKIPWPLLDRNHERTFRQNTVAFIKDILKEVPEARIPPFSPSFLSSPGGDRLVKFLWKFSLLVLKTVVQREDSDMPVLHYPTAGLHIVKNITVSTMKKLREEADDFCQFLIDASNHAAKLANIVVNQQVELKSMQSELADLVHRLENCPLSSKDKSLLLSNDQEQYHSVIKKWQDHINSEADKARTMLKDLESRSSAVTQCYQSVKLFVESKTMPLVLDATNFPSSLKDSNGNLHLAHVFSEGANAASAILKTLSVFNGFQSLTHVLPTLENMKEQLQNVEKSFAESKAGYIELISESSDGTHSSNPEAGPESPPMKGGLQHGYEMLQNAQTSTPPLIFNVDLSARQLISAESPPVEEAIGRSRLPLRTKVPLQAGSAQTPKGSLRVVTTCTPKTSQSLSGLSSRNLSGNLPNIARDLKYSKDVHKETANSSLNSVLQTPANFCPKQFSTSTVCKPTTAVHGNSSSAAVLKMGVRSAAKKPSESQLKAPPSKNKVGSRCADSKCISSVTLFKEGKSEDLERKDTRGEKRSAFSKIQFENRIIEEAITDAPIDDLAKNDLSYQADADFIDDQPKGVLPKTKSGPLLPAQTTVEEKDNSMHKGVLKDFTTLHHSRGALKTSPFGTPTRSPLSHDVNHKHKQGAAMPKVIVDAFDSTFDSPHSSSLGIFSPPSANNSFFSNDDVNKSNLGMLNEFEDDISPSGRVSLCPPANIQKPVENSAASEDKIARIEAPTNSRRKSLQAIISRYRDLVASSKPITSVHVSPPTSPVLDLSSEEFDVEIDVSLGHLNIE